MIADKSYYPYTTHVMLSLYNEGRLPHVNSVEVEPEYGYISRLTYDTGSHRVLFGNDIGINLAAPHELAKDKGHTKFMLRAIDVRCPDGAEFLLQWFKDSEHKRFAREKQNIKTVDQAPAYIAENFGYPVFVKPVDGSRGVNVFLVYDAAELEEVFRLYESKRVHVAVVEKPVKLPDYRIVCLDGEMICAYRRIPLFVVGDGKRTVRQLLAELERNYRDQGRDITLDISDRRVQIYMAHHGLTVAMVPAAGRKLTLAPFSNLSGGGLAEDVTHTIHPHWSALARRIAEEFGLRMIGLDLACADITSADADYSVIEVNSSPGLQHFASLGATQQTIVRELYTRVLNAAP